MTARVPRIGRLGLVLAAAAGGCVPEYNPQPFRGEADALADVTPLTSVDTVVGFARAGQPRVSPDGQWVVFRGVPRGASVAGGYGLFVARIRYATDRGTAAAATGASHVDGLDRPVRITPVGARCGSACFSPDGFSIVLACGDPGGGRGGHLRLYRADDWRDAVAMTDAARGVDLAQHPITPPGVDATGPDWSPTGRSIACTIAAADGTGLATLRPDGTKLVRSAGSGLWAGVFSPDGRRMAYVTGTPSQVAVADVVFDVAGDAVGLKDERVLTHEDRVASGGPCWLGGGAERLVYVTARHGDRNGELYVMNADGNRKTRLTMSPGPDVLPTATPDGRHLIWTACRPADAPPQLFAADLTLPRGS